MNFTLCKNRSNYTNRNKQSRNPSLRPTLPKPHYPSPCTTTLASLVKGEVLSPKKIRATTGGIAAPTLTIPTAFLKEHPSLAPHRVLASPRKRGGGLTASHKPKYYSVFM